MVESSSNKPWQTQVRDQVKKPMGKHLSSLVQVKTKEMEKEVPSFKDEDMVINKFESGSEDDIDLICNIALVLPTKYDCVIEVSGPVDYNKEEMAKHKPVWYFVINNVCIEEHKGSLRGHMKGWKTIWSRYL